ncbi:MAG TPA: methyltransferase domain-containing protein, partial [Bacillales bacterium]|nr:methyltransferase domain-containing protein [Bacillales bacterium]
EEIAEMAVNDVKSFANNNGFINLCLCYLVIVGFESHQALAHYGHMTEKEFISGEKHRPGASDSLEVELFIGLSAGFYERVEINGESCIRLTDTGHKRMKESLQMLTDSKYMQFRMQVMYVSQFDQLDDFEPIQDRLFPEAMRIRRGFLDFLNLKPGMEILELGCGSGSFTIDSGLADAVGEQGWVTATDPSAGMLQQAQAKIDRLAYKNISLEAVAAEQIPYGDQEFDGVVGVSFFHFTDNDQALKEMIRAARPGGVIGIQGPLSFNFDKPFFREWFEEFFLQAQDTGSNQPHHYLPKAGQIGDLLRKNGLRNVQEQTSTMPYVFSDPQSVIKFLVYGVGFFQKELIFMPLAARQALTDRLIEKGKDICDRYSIEERTIPLPTYYVKGTV